MRQTIGFFKYIPKFPYSLFKPIKRYQDQLSIKNIGKQELIYSTLTAQFIQQILVSDSRGERIVGPTTLSKRSNFTSNSKGGNSTDRGAENPYLTKTKFAEEKNTLGTKNQERRRPRLVLNHSTFIEGLLPVLEKISELIHTNIDLQQERLDLITIVPGRLSSTRSREPKLKIKVSVPLLSGGRNSHFFVSQIDLSSSSSSSLKTNCRNNKIYGKGRNKKKQAKSEIESDSLRKGDTYFIGFKALARKGQIVQELFFVGENLDPNSLQNLIDNVVAKVSG